MIIVLTLSTRAPVRAKSSAIRRYAQSSLRGTSKDPAMAPMPSGRITPSSNRAVMAKASSRRTHLGLPTDSAAKVPLVGAPPSNRSGCPPRLPGYGLEGYGTNGHGRALVSLWWAMPVGRIVPVR
jgi:hypothetical protein